MENLAILVQLAGVAIAGCVGYTLWNGVMWLLSLFGGVCLGC